MSQRPHLGATALVAGLLMALLATGCESGPSAQIHQVVIDATSYSPKVLDLRVGDTVVWTNRDLLVHTVTAESGEFDSKDIASGESWRYRISVPGEIDYLCTYHPTMVGSLHVR